MKRNESERRDTLSIACTILSRYKNEDTRAQRSSRAGIGGSVVITARVRRRGQARRRRFLLRWRRSRSFEQGYTPFSPVPFVDSLVRSLVATIVARIPGKHGGEVASRLLRVLGSFSRTIFRRLKEIVFRGCIDDASVPGSCEDSMILKWFITDAREAFLMRRFNPLRSICYIQLDRAIVRNAFSWH